MSHELPTDESRLIIRELTDADIDDFRRLQQRCFPDIEPWSGDELKRQFRTFPEGQIGIEMDGKIVAASSSVIVDGEDYERPHTFDEVSGLGYIENHDPEGDTLYGLDIVVDPDYRGLRLSRRIYDVRKRLVQRRNLRRFLIAGRIPEFSESETDSVEEYVRLVLRKQIRDPVLTTQIANGFSVRRILHDYLPEDVESAGHAVLMEWLNPEYAPPDVTRPRSATVAAAQYQMRPVADFDEFIQQCRFFAEVAAEHRVDLMVLPELLTNQLLGLVKAPRPGLAVRKLTRFTEQYVDAFRGLALKYNVNIVGGSILTVEDDKLYNVAYLFRRDGTWDRQKKLHITPAESRWWGVSGGDELKVFETDIGRLAILICYDIEFPELARTARARGAELFCVPYNTNLRSGHVRVRSCAVARCIENHVYCVMAGAVGNLPLVEGSDIHYAQSSVLTPSDIPFSRDCIGEEATPNVEALVVHEVDFALLRRTLRHGAVRTWLDRREDLYHIEWRGPHSEDESVVAQSPNVEASET